MRNGRARPPPRGNKTHKRRCHRSMVSDNEADRRRHIVEDVNGAKLSKQKYHGGEA